MAKPIFTLSQIVQQLQTQWPDGKEGQTFSWKTLVTFSLPSTSPPSTKNGNEATGFMPLTPKQEAMAREAFALWDDLIAIPLAETAKVNAPISFAYSTTTKKSASYTWGEDWGNGEIREDAIWINPNWSNAQDDALTLSSGGQSTFVHEIGHALGLSHPGTYNASDTTKPSYPASAEYSQDTLQWTVMSYFAAGSDGTGANYGNSQPSTPMLHDILAIQAKYGADMTTRTGNTTYGFNATTTRTVFDFNQNTKPVITIWDAGGWDTLDCSGYADNQRIDLHAGAFSDVGGLKQNVAIAYNCSIESAVGGPGHDIIIGNGVSNALYGGAGFDQLEGREGNDALYAGSGGGTLLGGEGDDVLVPGDGADALDGGPGQDIADYRDSPAGVSIDLIDGKVSGGWASNDTFVGIESFRGSSYNDYLRVDAGDNVLEGREGDDWMYAGAGNDTLFGGPGNDLMLASAGQDVMDGGAGFDTLALNELVLMSVARREAYTGFERVDGSPAADILVVSRYDAVRLYGGGGDDLLIGGDRSDWLQGGQGADTLDGGDGEDTASYADAPNGIHADLSYRDAASQGKVEAGDWGFDHLTRIENIEGSAYDDAITGDDGNNVLWGLGGNDRLIGGKGIDNLLGGSGDDSIRIGVDDFAYGGPGYDTASFDGSSVYIVMARNLYRLDGQGIVLGEFEAYEGTSGNDLIWAGASDERIAGNDGHDWLAGEGGQDTLLGGAGNDTLDGGAGDDTLSGGSGSDACFGGPGADRLVDAAADLNGDTFLDFGTEDVIEVSGLRFGASRYNPLTGLLELDTANDGGFATRITLNWGLQGRFNLQPSAASEPASTRIRLHSALDADTDGDGVPDSRDNAIDVPNPDQRDSDGDGYGNASDPDLNQDRMVDLIDLSLFDARYGGTDADADFNGDGQVDAVDLAVLDALFGGPPGRSWIDLPPAHATSQADRVAPMGLSDIPAWLPAQQDLVY